MRYFQSAQDVFATLLTHYEFGGPKPWFDPALFGTDPILQRIPAEVKRRGEWIQVLAKETGGWCFLSPAEYTLYRFCHGSSLSAVNRRWPAAHPSALQEFVVRLYWLGLLAVNGRHFFDPATFAESPVTQAGPFFIVVLSERCNLACRYCFADARLHTARPLEWPAAQRMVDLIINYPARDLTLEFTGGEPLLELDLLLRVASYARRQAARCGKGLRLLLQTNGTLLTAKRLKRLNALGFSISLSLDGDASTNDLTRHFPNGHGSYSATRRAIELMRSEQVDFGLICVVSRINSAKLLTLLDHFAAIGLPSVKFNPVFKLGRARGRWQELALTPEEYLNWHQRYLAYVVSREAPVIDENLYHILRNMGQRMHSYRCMRSQCGAGREFFTFTPTGAVYPCDRFREYEDLCLGNLAEIDDLKDLWLTHPLLKRIAQRRPALIDDCAACSYQRFCEAGCSLDSWFDSHSATTPHPWCSYYRGIYTLLLELLAEDMGLLGKLYPAAHIYSKSLFND